MFKAGRKSLASASTCLVLATILLPARSDPVLPANPSAEEILRATDQVRNPEQPFRVTLGLVEYIHGKARDRVELVVHARQDEGTGRFDNLVRYAGPPRDTGKMVLLRGSNLWFYDPASKASIRISAQQRLTGQAAERDVLAVNLARDYVTKIICTMKLQDADRQERECWQLEMTAATPEAIYRRIEYWIERGTYHPIKGKFYADSGRLLKIAYYHKYEEQLGRARPLEVILIDAVNPNLATVIDYAGYRFEDVPPAWFEREYLTRMPPE